MEASTSSSPPAARSGWEKRVRARTAGTRQARYRRRAQRWPPATGTGSFLRRSDRSERSPRKNIGPDVVEKNMDQTPHADVFARSVVERHLGADAELDISSHPDKA